MRNWAGQYPKIPEHIGQQILNSPKIMADCSRVRRRIRAMKTADENHWSATRSLPSSGGDGKADDARRSRGRKSPIVSYL